MLGIVSTEYEEVCKISVHFTRMKEEFQRWYNVAPVLCRCRATKHRSLKNSLLSSLSLSLSLFFFFFDVPSH